jgi:O-antigen/teichoic acid export membrane protein
VISRNAIVFLYGDLFIASANVLKIMSVVLIISPIGYILGSRILLITSNEKKMAICVGIGAVVNIVGNYFLIPIFNEIGAAIASIISESVVMVAYLSLGKRYYSLDFKLTEIIKIIIAIIAMLVVSICVGRIIKGLFVSLLAQSVLAGVVYFLLLYVMGETTTKEYVGKIIKRVRK